MARRAVLLLLGLLAAVSCGRDAERPRAVVIGDSVMRSAQGPVQKSVREHYETSVRIHIGPVAEALPVVRKQLGSDPDIAIIELGSGDALYGVERWRNNLNALLKATRGTPCVVFVTVNPVTDFYHGVLEGDLLTIADGWNAALRAAAKNRPNLQLVDWAGAVDANRALVSDGTHPNDAGARWLAEHLDGAIRACGSG